MRAHQCNNTLLRGFSLYLEEEEEEGEAAIAI